MDHTSVGHAYIFSNCHSLLIVFGKCIIGEQVAILESSGAIIGAIGGAITTMDTGSTSTSSLVINPSVSGDIVALAGAVGGVLYLINAKILREKLGVWIFISSLFISTSIMLIPVLYLLQVDFNISTDPQRGLFGWIHHLGTELIIVVICSGFGTLGFINAMKYFPPLVISVTMLLEPLIATIFSLLLGTAEMPHFLTFLGGFSVTLGTILVIWSSRRSSKTIDVTSAVISKQAKGYGTTT
ncbi:Drug/Metabolite Transporter (DMT) Superfamily [Thraustotheca clavata]|uniref:Drug/Metabolite Transporter (DMT) Superfamily n=1 Tax=Thraustotheca clavata TaxID=74557 RepID=A0A1W0AD39_9STRA|nr:Drug/Metabolite Transporter (DMT) Superfamily [Thraustotheca clavata]